jgi:hypothetical protein
MTLNDYTAAVREFLSKMNSDNENNKQKVDLVKRRINWNTVKKKGGIHGFLGYTLNDS